MKRVLIVLLVVVLICCGGAIALGSWLVFGGKSIDTVGQVDFVNKLAIPPLAPSTVENGKRTFDLKAQKGKHDFGDGHKSPTLGFNGDYLGPTLRAKRGEQVQVNVHNALDKTTTVHWHGMHLPPSMDGGPHQTVPANGRWAPQWKIDQPAATLWYHPHLHGETAKHVYNGLAGMFILDEDGGPQLPHEYGVDDIPVIVQDKSFQNDGKLDDSPPFLSGVGILGDTIAVNGTIGGYLDVTSTQTRLRVLNGSNARNYNFTFSDGRAFELIGTDGGLLEAPQQMRSLQLSPGERAEIVVAMKPGERTVLRSEDPDLGGGIETLSGGDDRFDIFELRAAAELKQAAAVPSKLADVEKLSNATVTRKFSLSGHQINDTSMEMNRIDFAVTKGTTEIWEVTAIDGDPHNFHVHDVQFQVIGGTGALSGWKDTINLAADNSYRLIMRFTDYADPNTPYMYHCHVLYHEDAGMMGQFVVVEPGQTPGTHH